MSSSINNTIILCEIKSTCSTAEVEKFAKKIKFYEKKEKVKISRKMIIPALMLRDAQNEADYYGIEVYSTTYDVKL